MELRVLKIFVDKETRKQLAEGDIIFWEDEARAEYAIAKGYVEPVKPVAKVEKAAETEKPVKKRVVKKK